MTERDVAAASEPAVASRALGAPAIAAIGLLSMVGPWASDLYLAAFPDMAAELGTTAGGVQWTLTAFMVGFGVGPLVLGPLSDRFGRWWPLSIASVVALVAAIGVALSSELWVMIALRLVQGVAGAAGPTLGRAVVADLVHGNRAARIFGVLMMLLGIAPVVAPLMGGPMTEAWGWRSTLWAIVAAHALMLGCVLLVPESLRRDLRATSAVSDAVRNFAALLRDRAFVAFAVALGASFGVLFTWISSSPFVAQREYGLSPSEYSMLFAVNAIVFLLAGSLSTWAVGRAGPRRVVVWGGRLLAASLAGLIVSVAFGSPPLWLVMVFVALASASTAPLMANSTALGIELAPAARIGAASALLGSVEAVLAAAVVPLLEVWHHDPRLGMTVVMALAGAIALVALAVGLGRGTAGAVD